MADDDRPLARSFSFWVHHCYEHQRLPEAQFIEVRRAFYSGAAAVFGTYARLAELPDEKNEEGLATIAAISDEIADFTQRLASGEV